MTDYAEEQAEEICALQAILMDDVEEVDGRGPEGLSVDVPCWQIAIRPEGEDDAAADTPVLMSLTFAHTPTYPDEPPLLRVRSVRGVSTADVEELQQLLTAQAKENLGMAQLFTLSTFAREWLREKAHIEAPLDEAAQRAARLRAEEAEEARREAERAAGTPVTPETYAEWWRRFSAETGGDAVQAVEKSKKLTGRRFFETRGEAAAGASEDEAEGEVPPEEEEADDADGSDEDEEDEWDPNDLGSDDSEDDAELLQKYLGAAKK